MALITGEIGLQMPEPFGDLCRIDARVGEAHEVLALSWLGPTKMHARTHRDTGRVEDRAPKILNFGESLQPHRFGDVRKKVERRIRLITVDPGCLVQERDCRVAPLPQDRQDMARSGLVARKPLEGAVLNEMIGTRLVIDVELGNDVDDLARPDRGAQSPTRHREFLREGIENDTALGHAFQRGERSASTRVADVEVRLIAKYHEVVPLNEIGEARELFRRALGAERILQVIQNEKTRSRRDGFLQRAKVYFKTVLSLDVAVGNGNATVELDLRLVDGITGVRVEDLVTRVHEGQHELADDGLASWLHRNIVRRIGEVVRSAHVGCQGVPQGRNTSIRTIASLAVLDRLERCLDHVERCRNVQVAYMERIDAMTLGCKSGRFGRHRKSCFGAQVGDAPRKLDSGSRSEERRVGKECRSRWSPYH